MDILKTLAEKLKEACDESIEHEIYGTSMDHIESIKRLPNDGPAFMFEVTFWSELGDESRSTEQMGLIQVMDLMARLIAERAARLAVPSFKD